jgi:low temperature requirement protein LtrA
MSGTKGPPFLVCFREGRIEEDTSIVKRDRVRQVIVAVIGLFYVGLLYPLYTDLWHSKWLIEMHNEECEPMFITFFVALGFFLLLAARKPKEYRTVIAFAATQSLAHSAVMTIQTLQAYRHGTPRDFKDVIITAAIGALLLALVPPREAPFTTT